MSAFARLRVAGAAAVLVAATGCSTFTTRVGASTWTAPASLKEGESRIADVLREVGPPLGVGRLETGCVFLYESSQTSEIQIGLPILQWLKFSKAWNSLAQQALVLTFDTDGVLVSANEKRWEQSLGGGSAVQVVFTVMSLSDTSEIDRPAEAHRWGALSLQPLPVTLGSAESPRSGANGLALRIAPQFVGQGSLEGTMWQSDPPAERESEKRR